MNLSKNFVFVDTETTGYHNRSDRIIEIAVIKVENGELAETFTTLINPEQHMSDFIEQYTGINSGELTAAPTFDLVADKLLALMEGSVFIAHNVNFDFNFLRNEFMRVGVDFNPDRVCTVRLSRQLYPSLKKYNLSNLIQTLGFDCPNRHRAYDDAHVLWQLYQKATKEFGEQHLAACMYQCMKSSRVPTNLDPELVDGLPESPGVYIFYGENELPLYVGKSVNIRKRVKSHFTGTITDREQSLHEQSNHIKAIQTPGELSALVLESRLVKEMMPIFNRKLRRKHEMILLKSFKNEKGYYQVNFERVKSIKQKKGESILGIFDSVRDCKDALTKTAEEYSLCCKLLGLENALTACFRYHLGKCPGACVCKESFEEYNKRFESAFQKQLLDEWPFEGSIKIIEEDSSGHGADSSYYIVDKWCLVENNGEASTNTFDFDIYKIIKDYVQKERAGITIQTKF